MPLAASLDKGKRRHQDQEQNEDERRASRDEQVSEEVERWYGDRQGSPLQPGFWHCQGMTLLINSQSAQYYPLKLQINDSRNSLNCKTVNCAYAAERVCWRGGATSSSRSERGRRVRHSSATSPSEQETQQRPQTEPSGIIHGSTGTAADRH